MLIRLRRWLADRIAPAGGQQYIGRELSHFVGRGRTPDEQYALLSEVLRSGWLLASPPQDKNNTGHIRLHLSTSFSMEKMLAPQMLCFCDIPARDLGIHCRKYSPFGLAFSKRFLADRGARPVTYVPRDGRTVAGMSDEPLAGLEFAGEYGADALGNWAPTGRHFDELIPRLRSAMERADGSPGIGPLIGFLDRNILAFYKFFDVARADEDPSNYYFEREWRTLGNVRFSAHDVVRVFMPSAYLERFRREHPSFANVAYELVPVAV